MAAVIYGDTNLFDHLSLHGANDQFNHYIEQQNQHAMGVLSDNGRAFIERAKSFIPIESVNIAKRMATMIKNKWDSYWDGDTIRSLTTITQVQLAPETMKPWIMANPNLYHYQENELIDGYSHYESQAPLYPSAEDNPYYLRVVSGDLVDNHYVEHLLIDDEITELSFEQMLFIKRAWALSDVALEENEDPTSKWGKTL